MEEPFAWTYELNKKLLQMRYEYDWLFKKKKQPWGDFYKILLANDFPKNMTVFHVRKRFSYMYEKYKVAKRERNKEWQYYKFFEKIYRKTVALDKFGFWNDEWRLKLITCIHEAKDMGIDPKDMWRTVEIAMRSQDLPLDCCIQDIKHLWQHLNTTFNRKYRLKIRKRAVAEWPLYDAMLEYNKKFDPQNLDNLELESEEFISEVQKRKLEWKEKKRRIYLQEEEGEFHWTQDITESFIQIRLQNDWMFGRMGKWVWKEFRTLLIEEYGFPKTLTSREIGRKWTSTYAEFQKAKATKNTSYVYYNLFQLYLGEGNLSLNPIISWQEQWVHNLIRARTDLEPVFRFVQKRNETSAWREVEKRLRSIGLPMDHSLLDIPEIWVFLLKSFRWKKKFAKKGLLQEQWPYYEAMCQYDEVKAKAPVKKQKPEQIYDECDAADATDTAADAADDDYEDDMKLFDLKQKMGLELKPKYEVLDGTQCRSCSTEIGCVNIFDQADDDGLNLAEKLKIIGGVEIEPSDNLPSLICLNCLQQLESAYKFRRRCQEVDNDYRSRTSTSIKVELQPDDNDLNSDANHNKEPHMTDIEDYDTHNDTDYLPEPETKVKKKALKKAPQKVGRKKKKVKKDQYLYYKVCEVCGKHTRNLKSHRDMHSTAKKYSCEICDKTFKFKSGLIIHKVVHNPTPRKTCEVCGKTFHIMAQYRRHFVYHANERKYECETCGKRFNSSDILRVHVRIHTDERPFSCPECGKTFRTAGCVSRHKRIVHRTAKVQQQI